MLPYDLKHKKGGTRAVPHKRKKQAIRIVEPRAVELTVGGVAKLLYLSRAEIPLHQGLRYFGVGALKPARIKIRISQDR